MAIGRILESQMRSSLALCTFTASLAAAAASVSVNGVMGDKALISVDGSAPRVVRAGERLGPLRLLTVGPNGVEIELDGRRYALALGQGVNAAPPAKAPRVVLSADGRGHFMADGKVNGQPVRFMVDTGASLVALPTSVARRAGVSQDGAVSVTINTANGQTRAQRVLLNTLELGEIRVNLVDALVLDDVALSFPLLGMSFLNRTNLQRDGDTLVLMQRY